MFKLLILTVAAVSAAFAYEFPSYIRPCSRNDPNLNQCIKWNIEQCRPHLYAGIPELSISPMNKLNKVKIEVVNEVIKLTMTNVELKGFSNFRVKDVQVDLQKGIFQFDFIFNSLQGSCDLNMEGTFLRTYIAGNGRSYANASNLLVSIKFDTKQYMKQDNIHLRIMNLYIGYEKNGPFNFDFNNVLFNHIQSSQTINEYFNTYQDEFVKDIRPALVKLFDSIVVGIFRRIFLTIPYKQLFPIV